MSGLVRAVTQFAHLVGDVIVQGSATSHMVPVEQADGEHEMSITQMIRQTCDITGCVTTWWSVRELQAGHELV